MLAEMSLLTVTEDDQDETSVGRNTRRWLDFLIKGYPDFEQSYFSDFDDLFFEEWYGEPVDQLPSKPIFNSDVLGYLKSNNFKRLENNPRLAKWR